MVIEKIDSMIGESRKNRDTKRVNALQLIKARLVTEQKSGKPYSDEVEIQALNSMVKQNKKSIAEISECKNDTAKNLIEQYQFELAFAKGGNRG